MKFIILSLALALIMGIVVSAQELKRAPIIIKKRSRFSTTKTISSSSKLSSTN